MANSDDIKEIDETDTSPTDIPDAEVIDADASETELDAPVHDPEAAPQSPKSSRGGLAATLLGGALCVVVGYGAAQFVKPDGWPFPGANTEELETRLGALEAASVVTPAELDQSLEEARNELTQAFEDQLAAIDLGAATAPLAQRIDDLSDSFARLDARLTSLEARPVAEAVVSPEATAAYEKQLAEMRSLLDSEVARLQAAKDEAEANTARASAAVALETLQQAVLSGGSFEMELRAVDLSVPEALQAVASDGIPSAAALEDSFPDAARAALKATAEAAYAAGEASWIDTVMRTHIGLRSTSPKEGNSPDAILSRAEQAVREDRLGDALAEISSLPPEGRDAFAPWMDAAEARLSAVTALRDMLGQ